MLYEGVIYLFVLALMLIYNRRSRATPYFIALVLFYWLCVCSCILYLAKDVYYFDTIHRYFWIERALFRDLVFLPVSRYTLIRGINYGALGFYACSLLFARAFTGRSPLPTGRKAAVLWGGYFVLQSLFYDPSIYALLYRLCYPALMEAATFHKIKNVFHQVLFFCNLALILESIIQMFLYAFRKTSLRIFRMQSLPIAFGYAVLMLFNTPIILMLPRTLSRISIVANGFITYQTLPLGKVEWIYTAAMIVNVLVIILIALFTVWRFRMMHNISSNQLVITQRIDAANTTSKVFCHYMKNELLALEAELDELDLPPGENSELLARIRQRCGRLYGRLDEAYRNTLQDQAHLLPVHILTPVRSAAESLAQPLEGFHLSWPRDNPKVMLDLSYFTLCMEDILRNAVEASEGVSAERKRIDISLESEPGYLMLSIRDHGKGVDPEVLSKMFQPFYSTKPVKENWGIGLSLAYRVVQAHGGNITVENAGKEGAVVHILLPTLDIDEST